MVNTTEGAAKKSKIKVRRRAFIKRMQSTDGLFESDWYEITNDVKKWGKIKSQVDSIFTNKFILSSMKMTFANDDGRYNPETDPSSIWYGRPGIQRTLIKVSATLVDETYSSGIWTKTEYPGEAQWDVSEYDGSQWDEKGANFIGMISGDYFLSDKNEVSFNIRPLTYIFKDFPAENLTGFTSTGFTASEFMNLVRDFQDNSGQYVFRPFFGNTTENFSITATTVTYPSLNTNSSIDIQDKSVWEVIEKLAEAENFVPYVKKNGVFYFGPRNPNSTSSYNIVGVGYHDGQYGHTIKSISRYGKRVSKYYSRVRLKWQEEETLTSYEVVSSDFTVSASNNPWRLGFRTLDLENTWINSTALANTIATQIFNEVSSDKSEIEFKTSCIPNIEVLDLVNLSYDASKKSSDELWDLNDWDNELTWARPGSDALRFNQKQFKIIEQEIDLDKLENSFIAREA